MIEDAQVRVHPNTLSIMISTTLQTKQTLVKSITFEQFLELVQALAEIVLRKGFKTNPQKALKKMIATYLLPLLYRLEQQQASKTYG